MIPLTPVRMTKRFEQELVALKDGVAEKQKRGGGGYELIQFHRGEYPFPFFLFRLHARSYLVIISLIPWHVMPSPLNPTLQEQRYDPSLFWQLALTSHGAGIVPHSLISINKNRKPLFILNFYY